MIRLPRRPLPWLALLLGLAAIPVSLSAVRPDRWDDCAHPEALVHLADHLEGEAIAFQRLAHSHVFLRIEMELPTRPGMQPFRARIVRTDEARYPVEQPTRFLRFPMDPEQSVVRRVEANGGSIPIHVLSEHFGKAIRVASSLYVYDGEPVDSLLPLQLRSAPAQLLRGRRPITLFQVHSHGPPRLREAIEERQIAWLLSAWNAYRELCAAGPTTPGADT